MLRAAMALLSTLQIGARIKESLERSLRQAAVIAVAVVLLVAAAVFGLIAAYHALVSIYQFDAAEAAAIMAGVLLFVGLIVIAIALSMGREPKRVTPSPLVATPDPTAMLDQGVGKAMQQVGPVPLLAIAFSALRPPVAPYLKSLLTGATGLPGLATITPRLHFAYPRGAGKAPLDAGAFSMRETRQRHRAARFLSAD